MVSGHEKACRAIVRSLVMFRFVINGYTIGFK